VRLRANLDVSPALAPEAPAGPVPNIIAIKVQAVRGAASTQTGFLPPNVMFASNFERKHL
jgi:hypothetical protein